MRKIFIIFLVFTVFCSTILAQEKVIQIDSIKINEMDLYVDFHVDSLFDEQVIQGLNRGLSIEITYQIELWKLRNNWFDQHIDGRIIGFKLSYNKLENRYIFVDMEERRSTGIFDKVIKRCSEIESSYITPIEKLKPENTYYIVIKGIVKPLSVENLNDISQWLKGEVENVDLNRIKQPKETGRSLRDYILEMLANVTGFGDRYFSSVSNKFIYSESGEIVFQE